MKSAAYAIFACVLLFAVAMRQSPTLHTWFYGPKAVKLFVATCRPDLMGVVKKGTDIPTSEELDANDEEGKMLFRTAFATESACQGIDLTEQLPKPYTLPTDVKKLPHSLVLLYDRRSPGHWAYSLNYNGDFGAVASSEHEVAKQVCQIIRKTGGSYHQADDLEQYRDK
jgi:hypothetical protein